MVTVVDRGDQVSLDVNVDMVIAEFERTGYVVITGLYPPGQLDELQAAMERLQTQLASGELDRTYAGDEFVGTFEGEAPPYAHYVLDVTELSTAAHDAFYHPVILEIMERCLGPDYWIFAPDGRAVAYQDARPGEGMTYTRIGWHSDHQSRPNSAIWPGIAVTVHLDATSPANGFLRVRPASHRMGTDDMPLGFEKVPDEVGVYCNRGDVILHHSDLWHSAARATEDAPGGVRRHMRGSFMGGTRPGDGELEPFNKNAMR